MLAIRLPTDIEERLDRLARATGRTKTFYAREAILDAGALKDLRGLDRQIARRIIQFCASGSERLTTPAGSGQR